MRTHHFISTLILLFFLTTFSFLYIRLNSQLLYLKAANRIQKEDYHTAIDHLENAIQKQPNEPLIWKGLAKAYQNIGKSKPIHEAFDFTKKSEHAYLQATLLNPLDATAFYGLAQETAKLEQLYFYLNPAEDSGPYNALPYFQEALRLRPNGIRYHYGLMIYQNQKNNQQELIRIVSNLVRIYPQVYNNLKKEAFWTSDLNEAAKKGMFQAIEQRINLRNTHISLSYLLETEKEWSAAISMYQKALTFQSIDNTSADYFHLGHLYLENSQFKKAEEHFFKALTISQDREKDLEKVYRFYKTKGHFEALNRFCNRVSERFIFSDRIFIFLARSLINQKRYHEARKTLIDLNQKEPSAEAYYWLSRISEIEKDWDSMDLAIQKATVLDPDNSQYRLIFSKVLQRLNKLERAEKEAGLSLKNTTKPSTGLFNHRAWIRWKRNDFIGAAKDWESAIRINPAAAHFYAQAAEAYMRLGKQSRAADYYKKAMNLNPKNKHFQKRYNEMMAKHQEE